MPVTVQVATLRRPMVLEVTATGETIRAALKVESSGFSLVFSWSLTAQCYVAYDRDSSALWVGSAAFELPVESCQQLEQQLAIRAVYSNLHEAKHAARR